MLCPFDFSTLQIPGPEGRAQAIKASLTQIAAIDSTITLTLAEVLGALAAGAFEQEGDTPPVAARRATVRDILSAAKLLGYEQHGRFGGLPWFTAQILAWGRSEDPRQKAMALTAYREGQEAIAIGVAPEDGDGQAAHGYAAAFIDAAKMAGFEE